MRRLMLLVPVLVLLAWTTPSVAQPIDRTVAAPKDGTLDLRLQAGGSVTVTGWDRQEIAVRVERSGRDADRLDLQIDPQTDAVVVTSGMKDRRNGRVDVTYAFRVPTRYSVRLDLTGGDVRIEGVDGSMSGRTMGGNLVLTGLGGSIDLETMGGNVSLTDSNVSGKVQTMGGDVTLTDVAGDVDATTMGGDIRYRSVRPTGKSETRVRTMGGDIDVADAPGGADVSTMGGDVTVGTVTGFLKAETMGGNIVAGNAAGWVEARTMGGNVTVRVTGTGGDRHVDLSSMGGNIDLTLPAGLSMAVDAEITLQGRSAGADDYRIESDFPLTIKRPEASDRGRRMQITGTGTFAGGANSVKIRTVNGNVRIRRGG